MLLVFVLLFKKGVDRALGRGRESREHMQRSCGGPVWTIWGKSIEREDQGNEAGAETDQQAPLDQGEGLGF